MVIALKTAKFKQIRKNSSQNNGHQYTTTPNLKQYKYKIHKMLKHNSQGKAPIKCIDLLLCYFSEEKKISNVKIRTTYAPNT